MTATTDAPETETIDTADGTSPNGLSYGKVFSHARTGTVELSKATGGLAFLILRSGWLAARKRAVAARANKTAAAVRDSAAAAERAVRTEQVKSSRGKRTLVIAGLAAAVLLIAGGAAALRWSRRQTPPEPAAAPPSLQPAKSASGPDKDSSATGSAQRSTANG